MIVTVPLRRAKAMARLHAASASVIHALRAFATANGGRYVVFGSFARGDFAPSSDFDVMVDFPAARERDARAYAETVCRDAGLEPDVHLASDVSDRLMLRVTRDGLVLG